MEPCIQAVPIARIETTLNNVVTLLERHEDRDDRMLAAMEQVAAQTATIQATNVNVDRHEKEISELYDLYRLHSEKKDERSLAARIVDSEMGIWFIAAIIFGTILDCVAHYHLVIKLLDLIRG